jgi:hypothetical protein
MEQRKLQAEKAIKESGIPFTIFCPTFFMESLPLYVKSPKAYVFGKQPNKIHFLSAEDYANMVLVSYQSEEAINKRYILHGTEGFLFREALEMYVKAIHPEIKTVSMLPFFMARLIARLTKNQGMRETADFMQFIEKTGEMGDPSEAYRTFGKPKITLEKWIENKRRNT